MTNHHFFATHALGFSRSDVSREDAIEKLLMDRRLTDPKWVNNCLKSGEPLTVFTCQVNVPVDEPYRIEWYQPVGVETQDGQNFFVLHLSAKAHAVMRDPGDEARKLKARVEDLTEQLDRVSGEYLKAVNA